MKKRNIIMAVLVAMSVMAAQAQENTLASPDGRLRVTLGVEGGKAYYSVQYDGKQMLQKSALGFRANTGDYATGLKLDKYEPKGVSEQNYTLPNGKRRNNVFKANHAVLKLKNAKDKPMEIQFAVADNDVAFRYHVPQTGDTQCMVVQGEATAFNIPQQATAFITPQSDPMVGWMRTKPSYEEGWSLDAPLTNRSHYKRGYTFPALFRVGADGWVLLSESGTDGNYVGCRLSDYDPATGYTVAFPMEGESNGYGTATAAMALPATTPWRTITVGADLKPIVETQITQHVAQPKYQASEAYKPGRYTWSWLVWQDGSINYDDQVRFIDTAAKMGYEYCLVDANWDRNIGYKRMEELSAHAREKGVRLLLWYNSNGAANDAPQTPKHRMDKSAARRREMAWMQKNGIAGIKVDFFGGDKQHTMQLYEDILTDANEFGLQVIFHGCTLPRGWERMYPNFVGSEAVLASENVFFGEWAAKNEAKDLTIYPFCRNAVAAMDWGGTIMNKYLSKDNKSRHKRHTTDIFEMAAAIVVQTSVQCIAVQPNNLTELPAFELDFLRQVPTAWDDTRFVDGYPGKYVVIARRSGDSWYVAGLNAESAPKRLTLTLPEFAGKTVSCYIDDPKKGPQLTKLKVSRKGIAKVTMQPGGGLILKQ